MGKQRRKFRSRIQAADRQRGCLRRALAHAAARKYEISPSVIARRCEKSAHGALQAGPSAREKALERENRDLKEKLAELYLQVQALKKWRTTHAGRKTPIPA